MQININKIEGKGDIAISSNPLPRSSTIRNLIMLGLFLVMSGCVSKNKISSPQKGPPGVQPLAKNINEGKNKILDPEVFHERIKNNKHLPVEEPFDQIHLPEDHEGEFLKNHKLTALIVYLLYRTQNFENDTFTHDNMISFICCTREHESTDVLYEFRWKYLDATYNFSFLEKSDREKILNSIIKDIGGVNTSATGYDSSLSPKYMYQLVAKTFDCTEQSQIELADQLLYSLYTQLINYNDEKNKEEEKNDVWLKKLHASPVKNLFTLLKEAQGISGEKSMEESYKEFMQEAEERQINLERYDIHTNSDLNEPYTKAFEDLIKRKGYIQLILDVIYRYVHGKTLSEYESNLITYLMDLVQKKPFSGKNN